MARDALDALTPEDEQTQLLNAADTLTAKDREDAPYRGVETPDPATDAKVQESDSAHYAKAIKQLEESNQRIEGLYKERGKAIEPVRQDLQELAETPNPQVPRVGLELEKQPKPPDRRQMMQEFQENTNGIMVAFSALAMFGAMRNGPTSALSFLGGALKGLQEGQADQAAQAWKQFEAETNRVVQKNKDIMGEYKAILESKKLDFDQKIELQKIVASKYDDRIAHEMLMRKDFVTLEALFAKRDVANIQLQKAMAQLVALKAKALAAAQAQQGGLSEDTIDRMAKTAVDTGDPSAVVREIGLRGGSKVDRDRLQEAITIEQNRQGVTPAEMQVRKAEAAGLVSAERAGGTLTMKTERFANEALGMVKIAEEKAKLVPRSQFLPVNKLLIMVQNNTASKEQAEFAQANFALLTAYTKAINPQSGGTESQRKEAFENLLTASSHEAYAGVLEVIKREIAISRSANETTRTQIKGQFLRDRGAAPVGGASNPNAGNVDDPLGILH